MTPYDLTGPSFLGLYGIASALSIAGAFAYRTIHIEAIKSTQPPPKLGPYEMAYLSGGTETALLAALASLIQSEAIRIDTVAGGRYVKVRSGQTAEREPLIRDVLNAIPSMAEDNLPSVMSRLKERHLAALQLIRKRLEQHDLIFTERRAAEIALATATIAALPVILSIPKLVIGTEHHKPVGFLIMGMIAVSTMAALFLLRKPLRTAGGDDVLNRTKRQEAALLDTASADSHLLTNHQAALAVALFSTTAFGLGPLYDLRKATAPPSSGACGSGSCGGGSCSGGGCGGGCGGCGGS